MSAEMHFKKIAVIGAGTMGSGIAAQIANAGLDVLLLDLAAKNADLIMPADAAVERLVKSDPPQLVSKKVVKQIHTGTIEHDFNQLADYDWIIEAVVERLDIKKHIYSKLNDIIKPECIVTSNTSSIPIAHLMENMPVRFQERFAITHYFNPVRYMRLLELVVGEHTKEELVNKLSQFNDVVLGKGIVKCNDTPGFLGNRLGVYAMQVGLFEALKHRIPIDDADAILGRPMGIPKTGVFGLYDLIGIDLMSDVVTSMREILPDEDAFQKVGTDPDIITKLIQSGYTGNKGLGGFYAETKSGKKVRDLLADNEDDDIWRDINPLPEIAEKAALAQSQQKEALLVLIQDNSNYGLFARSVLAHIFCYAGQLLGSITTNPQDIDDAMKLGFNWQRGPFEMIDAIGAENLQILISDAGLTMPNALQINRPFYQVENNHISVLDTIKGYVGVSLPVGSFRLQILRRTLPVLAQNNDASCYKIENDMRLVEFHSKANALRPQTIEILKYVADNPGRGVIIHNDAQHFSAGVDLNHFRALIETKKWQEIDDFLAEFQQAVVALKYLNVPVVGAPSGLAIGGGFEVLAHCDALVAHVNSTFGLVESGVGLLPAGGGVKQTYLRWFNKTGDWNQAAWQCWMQIGYGKIGTSPELSARYCYFLDDRDVQVMNKDRVFLQAVSLNEKLQKSYLPPAKPAFRLADPQIRKKMFEFMEKGVTEGMFTPHNLTTAMAIADVIVAKDGEQQNVSEQDIFNRERENFIRLARTPETLRRISTLLDSGQAEDN
ncbi:3-hydroxyacyl-CoA dehydrogenase NAD-binding domain-containing protein [Alphaproteobacteria bacterium]|nr:3-hydroxyacyl-CoA dehydrogenase NAD-binding domain-containing protein [Alphaproteobacteria bacterium]